MLRTTDLERAGCRLELPDSRIRSTIPGQDVWVEVVQALTRASMPAARRPDRNDMASRLRRLSADDFALLKSNPPLLYHNDLTGTVPRYYWSADVGYALWLRLAQEAALIAPRVPAPSPAAASAAR